MKKESVATLGYNNASAFESERSAIWYLAYSAIHGAYDVTSLVSDNTANCFLPNLRGKDILDIGCGIGATTNALAHFEPKRILAADLSLDMIRIFRHIHFGEERELFEKPIIRDSLKQYYFVAKAFVERYKIFATESIFRKNGGNLLVKQLDCFALNSRNAGLFDVVVGNHFLHWPIGFSRLVRDLHGLKDTIESRVEIMQGSLKPFVKILKREGSPYSLYQELLWKTICARQTNQRICEITLGRIRLPVCLGKH